MLTMSPPVDDRAPQALVETKQVMRVAFDRFHLLLVEKAAKDREVVLLIVDGIFRTRWRRPREHGVAGLSRPLLEPLVIRNRAGDGAHHVERVKRRHTRARFTQLDSGIG